MTDYGHDLKFGTFITPSIAHPQWITSLSRITDQLGLDLVTFQDHPYHPGLLDTWTLLTWIAAKTKTVHVAPNVLNVPLRPPAVVARAAASLDLLSGGRVELALGAGGFMDAVAAMGGPSRSGRDAVQALDEAIQVIRAIWDTDQREVLRFDGSHYRLQGAKRGPQPAHDIQIWLGAYKPAMLRLVGRRADGWLPSASYLQQGQLDRGNQLIDESATKAGRTPRDVRRMLNVDGRFEDSTDSFLTGKPHQWVEALLPLALEHGISVFILATDDPTTIERYAQEVAPALREAVAAERRDSEAN